MSEEQKPAAAESFPEMEENVLKFWEGRIFSIKAWPKTRRAAICFL